MAGLWKVFVLTPVGHAHKWFVDPYADTFLPAWSLWAHRRLDPVRRAGRGRAPPPRLARARGADRAGLRPPDRDVRPSPEGAALRVPHPRDSRVSRCCVFVLCVSPGGRPLFDGRMAGAQERCVASERRPFVTESSDRVLPRASAGRPRSRAQTAQRHRPPGGRRARADGASVDSILAALYESVSHGPDAEPNWDRMRGIMPARGHVHPAEEAQRGHLHGPRRGRVPGARPQGRRRDEGEGRVDRVQRAGDRPATPTASATSARSSRPTRAAAPPPTRSRSCAGSTASSSCGTGSGGGSRRSSGTRSGRTTRSRPDYRRPRCRRSTSRRL